MKRNWIALLLVAGLAACATAPTSTTQIAYRGGTLEDDASGIIVRASDDKDLIVVLNWRDHYAVALPYSTDWKFTAERGSRLRGGAGNFNLTLTIEPSSRS